jgi:glutathione-regulated potassium-efflux system protein KefB
LGRFPASAGSANRARDEPLTVDIKQLMFAAAVVMFVTAIAVGVAKELKLGSIVALLVVGIALGPHSPMPLLTGHVDEMQAIGQIGVMLLMFAVGLDLRPTQIWSMRQLVFGLGSAQYVLTTAGILAFVAVSHGIVHVRWQSALVVSLGLAMSSSAIPLPMLQERGETTTAHGRAVIAIDFLQGLLVVPVLAVIPFLGAVSTAGGSLPDLTKALKVVAALVGVFALGRFVLPRILALTARGLGPRGFVPIVLAAVFFAGWWVESVGISMALGAFMIGILLSTSVYAEQVKAAVTPAKQLLLAIFFIAIGMAIDLKQLAELKTELLLYLPSLLLIKAVVLYLISRGFGLGLRAAILTGLLMMPFDEIAYVILASANAGGLLSPKDYTLGLSLISLSFIVSPLLINLGYRLSERLKHAQPPDAEQEPPAAGSVVVAGYRYVGRTICTMLEQTHVSYSAFDIDLDWLAKGRTLGHSVRYGDVADPAILQAIAFARPRLLIATNGADRSIRYMIDHLHKFYPHVPVIAAVPYLAQREELRRNEATEVIALAPEGILSFGRRILDRLGVAAGKAESVVGSLQAEDYKILRTVAASESDAVETAVMS